MVVPDGLAVLVQLDHLLGYHASYERVAIRQPMKARRRYARADLPDAVPLLIELDDPTIAVDGDQDMTVGQHLKVAAEQRVLAHGESLQLLLPRRIKANVHSLLRD